MWLYTDYLGAISPVKITISDNGEIKYNQADYIASLNTQTRGVTNSGHNYLDDWMLMQGLDWDKYGLPSIVEKDLSLPSSAVLYSIKETYNTTSGKRIKDLHSDWLNNNTTSEIKITKATELSLVFVASGASWSNAVGYFTYPTGTTPTLSSIKKILAFPNASPISKVSDGQRAGALLCGHEVKLKYWNEVAQQFEDEFPEGVTIGWCLEGASFKDGNVGRQSYAGTRYSYSSLNSDNEQRVVALRDGSTDQIVAIGFEDNKDFDYCDATFYLKIANPGSIDTEVPELPSVDPPTTVNNTVTGLLAFEDLWPSQGDYDMNDLVMIIKERTISLNKNNKVEEFKLSIDLAATGATKSIGAAIMLDGVPASAITQPVEFSDNSLFKGFNVNSNLIENGQDYAVIPLFDDAHKALGRDRYEQINTIAGHSANTSPKNISFTIKFSNPISVDELNINKLNVFIFVEGNRNQRKEIHIVGYQPTKLANTDLFGGNNDDSSTSRKRYYISKDNLAWGIMVPTDFKWPLEYVNIKSAYSLFESWVTSGGTKNEEWWKTFDSSRVYK